MKKLMSFFTLFLGISIFSIAQSNIAFHFKSNNGTIMTEERGMYNMSFEISGLKTETEVTDFKKVMASNAIVKSFEIFKDQTEAGKRKARLIINSKEKEKLAELLKTGKINKIFVDGKEYSSDQLDKISEDLKIASENKSTIRGNSKEIK